MGLAGLVQNYSELLNFLKLEGLRRFKHILLRCQFCGPFRLPRRNVTDRHPFHCWETDGHGSWLLLSVLSVKVFLLFDASLKSSAVDQTDQRWWQWLTVAISGVFLWYVPFTTQDLPHPQDDTSKTFLQHWHYVQLLSAEDRVTLP